MFGLMRASDRKTRGFTLIELLVVIAIIAILAAILFPVFTKARDSAKLSRCLVHLNEIGKAIHSYVDDNNGRYPIGPDIQYAADGVTPQAIVGTTCSQYIGGVSKGHGATAPWPKDRPLFKYTAGNLDIWKCPSEQKQWNSDGAPHENEFPSTHWGTSYIFNGVYSWDGKDGPDFIYYTLMGHGQYGQPTLGPRTVSEVTRPTKIWMVGERTMHHYWTLKFKNYAPVMLPLGHQNDRPFSPVVYCDGHSGTIMIPADVLVDPNGRWAFNERNWHPHASKWGSAAGI